jgi:hypothetical protein
MQRQTIKWSTSLFSQTGHAGPDSLEARVNELFRQCSTQQIAYSTIRANVTNGGIENCTPDTLTTYLTFVDIVLESLCITGFAIWKWSSATDWEVAPPTALTLSYTKKHKWIITDYLGEPQPKEWKFVIVDYPIVPIGESPIVRAWHWRSSTRKAVRPSMRLAMIEAQWLARDQANSKPGCFTAVDKDIQYTGKNPVPFFLPVNSMGTAVVNRGGNARGRTHSAIDPNYGQPTQAGNMNFQTDADRVAQGNRIQYMQTDADVADKQHKTLEHMITGRIRALDRLTSASDISRKSNPLDVVNMDPSLSLLDQARTQTQKNPGHIEHIVTDGRSFAQMQHLQTANDATTVHARARQTILYVFGVPPQATGEAINSERNASSHRQYEVAMNLARVTIARFMTAINTALSTAPCHTAPHLISVVSAQTAREIGPLLTTNAHINMLSAVYNIPTANFCATRVQQLMPEQTGSPQEATTVRNEKGTE